MNCLSLARYVTPSGKIDLPDVPYRVLLRLRPKTLQEASKVLFQ